MTATLTMGDHHIIIVTNDDHDVLMMALNNLIWDSDIETRQDAERVRDLIAPNRADGEKPSLAIGADEYDQRLRTNVLNLLRDLATFVNDHEGDWAYLTDTARILAECRGPR